MVFNKLNGVNIGATCTVFSGLVVGYGRAPQTNKTGLPSGNVIT